ncbi:hypothetical protein [Pinisolibacter sp.]|uniref:hypothetical protein n=1 Tax=Pinisolibacter sp. TaxID=2172024 RepID=UPI002FDE94DF
MDQKTDVHSMSQGRRATGDGRNISWRRTWPFGADDDFVADLPGGGWARIRLVHEVTGDDHWDWSFVGRHMGRGAASSRDVAEWDLARQL